MNIEPVPSTKQRPVVPTLQRPRLLALIFLCVAAHALPANAALVTTHEAGLDLIFSQASFGNQPIDIRFGTIVEIVNSAVITIDSAGDFVTLFSLAPNPGTHVNMFFVDEINWCGTFLPNIAGCATTPGDIVALNSEIASGSFGAELLAHEMAHNFGLDHTDGAGLMGPFLNNDTTLSLEEVNTIRLSPLVKLDLSGSYVDVTPILIRAAAVPEPSTVIVYAVVGAIAVRLRRRSELRR